MVIYSPKIIQDIVSKLDANKSNPILISIAGGSATGKTSLVAKEMLSKIKKNTNFNSQIINQDNFQIGRPFVDNHKTKYKWDDPKNFDLEMCNKSISELLSTYKTKIPIFSVKNTRRTGFQSIKINSNSLLIFEGLYTFYNESLINLADYKIYVQSYFYARLLRRIFRFIYELNIPNYDVALKQMVLKVQLANREQVSQQKQLADLVITTPYSFTETYNRFNLNSKQTFDFPEKNILWRKSPEKKIELIINNHKKKLRFNVCYNNKNYYTALISEKVFKVLNEIDLYSYD